MRKNLWFFANRTKGFGARRSKGPVKEWILSHAVLQRSPASGHATEPFPHRRGKLGNLRARPSYGKSRQNPFPAFSADAGRGAPMQRLRIQQRQRGPSLGARCLDVQDTQEALTFTYQCGLDLAVTCVLEKLPQGVFRQVNRVENRGREPVTLQQFASAMVCGIAAGGLMSWNDDREGTHPLLLQSLGSGRPVAYPDPFRSGGLPDLFPLGAGLF